MLHGEAASVDLSKISEFKNSLSEKLADYSLANVFNIDETDVYI
jgi:hypothetical protein